MRLELFPFRYRDPLTGKWIRARYVAERHVIAERYAEWEILGPPEIRDGDPDAAHFNPYTNVAAVGNVGAILAVARAAGGERPHPSRRRDAPLSRCASARLRTEVQVVLTWRGPS